jgi:phage-related protein
VKTNRGRMCLRLLHALALVTLAIVFCTGMPVSGQGMPSQDNDIRIGQIANMDRFLDSHPEVAEQLRKDPSLIRNEEFVMSHPALQEFLQQHPGIREEFTENPNAFMRAEQRFERQEEAGNRRGQLANMDRFLDSHPEIAEQLSKDPSLIKNQDFLAKHPQLQEFLQQHPGIREEFTENPNAFMRAEQRFERQEEAGNRRFGDGDTTRGQLANMDRFLDTHPEVAEQLSKDPSLIKNQDFLAKHPQLQEFLQQHPGIREEFTENPNAFMRAEQRFERQEEAGNRRFGDGDTTRGQLANMDRFLDSHPEIAEQLSKDPSLIKNQDFLAKHPQLQEFLQQHPGVREEFTENPAGFMRAERRFEGQEDLANRGDRTANHGEPTAFGRFLSSHSVLAQQLSKDPSLVNNKEFLASHPDLQNFLQSHPGVTAELSKNPQAFLSTLPPATMPPTTVPPATMPPTTAPPATTPPVTAPPTTVPPATTPPPTKTMPPPKPPIQ